MLCVIRERRGRFIHVNTETAHREDSHMVMEVEIGVIPLQTRESQGLTATTRS